ncbi:hypothetical protein P7B02_13600 [Caulobacter segnis]|uniref:hypothetical protein n=1 Tax=Caulobacter segnis TaxID=88688 RepID=UPI00240F2ACF|nr:hypothetical protein [Caulobacter segnis]MDG2522579.1 hypothetical protein [Caulobacter segnis]
MRRNLLFVAYGYLFWAGALHFLIEVVLSHLGGRLTPGPQTSLYYGLHSAYALGQVAFGLAAVLIVRAGSDVMARRGGLAIGIAAASAWLVFAFLFIDYVQPRIHMAVVLILLIGAALSREAGRGEGQGAGWRLAWLKACGGRD